MNGAVQMIRKSLVLLICFSMAACSTFHKKKSETWIDLFTPTTNSTCTHYNAMRLERDYTRLIALTQEMEDLANEMASLKRRLLFRPNPYFSETENREVELILFRFLQARNALMEMVQFYYQCVGPNGETHTKGAVLGTSAVMNLSYYTTYFVALFHDEKSLIKLINTARPSYEIPEDVYKTLRKKVTEVDQLERLDVIWYLFCKELAKPEGHLIALKNGNEKYRVLINKMDALHASTHIQIGYILQSNWSSMPELHNRLRHTHIAKIGDDMGDYFQKSLYKGQGLLFKNVSQIKNPTIHPLHFSKEQVSLIKSKLRPGDIILTYSAGYMSNIFLPGQFKHGITYIGTVADRKAAGLSDQLLQQRAISPAQAKRLIQHVNQATLLDGSSADVIEAVSEGVVFNSLDRLLADHINRLVILRPNCTHAEKINQLVRLFQYLGTPYDFKFNFQNDSNICCTELIYRTLHNQCDLDFSLVKKQGIWVLSADDILHYYLKTKPKAFTFILLATPANDGKNARVQDGTTGYQALQQLMNSTK